MFVFFSVSWTDFFFLHDCSIRILRFFYVAIEVAHIPTLILFSIFFFTKAKEEIRNLSSSESCRCLQAQ